MNEIPLFLEKVQDLLLMRRLGVSILGVLSIALGIVSMYHCV